jgi:hypothetical protein
MTQDPNGQPPASGLARDESVPDGDADGARHGTATTRFEKVASGPAADETAPQADETAPQAAIPDASAAGPGDESERAPGDVGDLAYGKLLPDSAEFTTRWQRVQFRFVDDPRGAVTEAADVLTQATAMLQAAIAERQRALHDRWSEGQSADTEWLRETLLMYRAFLHQLTS